MKAGKVLGEDVSFYEELYRNIVETFRKTFTDYRTQTEHVLAVHFHLAEDPQKTADALADMVVSCGSKLQTGFVGTPYLLHVLSSYGHTDLAYTLLLRGCIRLPKGRPPYGSIGTASWRTAISGVRI